MLRNQSEKDIALSNRPAKYDEMIKIEQAEAGTKKNWLKERPYQLKYKERLMERMINKDD